MKKLLLLSMHILLYFLIAGCFTGCFTMTDRIVVLSDFGISIPEATRAELSDALDIVDQIARENQLHLQPERNGTNLVASYVGPIKHGFFNNGTAYMDIDQYLSRHALVITTSDNPPNSKSGTVFRIQKEIYQRFTARFGKERVTKTKTTMHDSTWFE
jgi:hypothetical protein